jgi:hypothetical protein
MTRLTLLVLAAFAVACFAASRLGGTQASGILVGYCLGAGLAGLSFLYTRHVLATRPGRVFTATVSGFLIKLLALLLGALAFRYIPQAAERADWRAFVVAYGAAVALILPLGAVLVLRAPRRASPNGGAAA